MSNLTTIGLVLTLMIMSGIGGAFVNNFYTKHQYVNYVKLEKTKSGTFFIKDEHIYSVSELMTERQNNGLLTASK